MADLTPKTDSGGFSPVGSTYSGFPDSPRDNSVKQQQMDNKTEVSPQPSSKVTDKSNVTTGLNAEKVSASEVKDGNRNSLNNGLENGQFTYEEMADTDPNYTGGIAKQGVPSMFNNYSIFIHSLCNSLNDFKDLADQDGVFNHTENAKELTLVQLLDRFSPEKTMVCPYYANDFLYAKYYNKIPLNHLITLRRFPYPTYDSLEFADDEAGEYRPIAQAITYFGEPTKNRLSDIFKINGKINWKNVSAQIWDVESTQNKSLEDSQGIFRMNRVNGNNKMVNVVNNTTTIVNNNSGRVGSIIDVVNNHGDIAGRQSAGISAARASYDFSYTHKVYGPINVIKDTMTRDTGIGGDLSFSLVFDYQLKSYNNINPKLAFLDLINNLLALTYFHAKWWGGANRFYPKPMAQFGFLGDQNAFYSGDYGKYFESVGDAFKNAGQGIINVMGEAFQAIMSGNFSALANMLFNGASKLLDIRSKKSRPNAVAVHSLVSGAPVGEYHCVIGNPMNPIACIGNLVMQSFEITFSDSLGFDDFPDELQLKVNLKKARASDSGDIESWLNNGYGRTYVPEKGIPDLITNVSNSKQFVTDKKTRNKSVQGLSQSFGTVN